MDLGLASLIGVAITAVATIYGFWYTAHSGQKSTDEATAVAWSRELRAELSELRVRVEKLESSKRFLVGFVDDFGEWVFAGANPPPPFPPTAIHNEIDMSRWQNPPRPAK